MSQMHMSHPGMVAAQADTDERLGFIRRTYLHLFGAILLFTLIEAALFTSGVADRIGPSLLGGSGWIVVFVLFIGASWFANRWAMSGASPALQYAGLGVFIIAQSIIFLPLLYVAVHYGGGLDTIGAAGSVTIVLCGLTTLFVLITKKDFSFLGWGLVLCSGAAFVAIILGMIFGWQMGGWFSALMIVLGLGYLLYETSNILYLSLIHI